MKNILMASFAFLLFGFQNLKAQTIQQVDTISLPEILFETMLIDYGTIECGSDGSREFKFKNTGKQLLIITNVNSSCGCVVPSYPKEPIKPGATAIIKVRYDTKRVGNFQKSLTVYCNARTPTIILRIKGSVLPPKKEDPVFPSGK